MTGIRLSSSSARIAAGLAVAGLAAGCSPTVSGFGGIFSASIPTTAADAPAPVGSAQSAIDCPTVTIRSGAGALSVTMPGEAIPENQRHQLSFGELSRDCALVNGIVTMRIGVQGRVVLGPAGRPGPVEIPLRYAVVKEGPEPQTIASMFQRTSVNVPPGQGNMPFVHVMETLSFPMPADENLDAYVVYVGFDPQGDRPPARRAPPRRRS